MFEPPTELDQKRREVLSNLLKAIRDYYERETGLSLALLHSPCFCLHNSSCKISGTGPRAVPNIKNGQVELHIHSPVKHELYPSQIIFQYSFDLWQALAFQDFGLQYDWFLYQDKVRPYAYAAALCALAQTTPPLLPFTLLSADIQKAYFEKMCTARLDPLDIGGDRLAEEAHYSLGTLYKRFVKEIHPIVKSQSFIKIK